jgi:hypothetical protein
MLSSNVHSQKHIKFLKPPLLPTVFNILLIFVNSFLASFFCCPTFHRTSWFCSVNSLSSVKKNCDRFAYAWVVYSSRPPFQGIRAYKIRHLAVVNIHRIYTLCIELATAKITISASLFQNYVLFVSQAQATLLSADWSVTYANNKGVEMNVNMGIVLTLVVRVWFRKEKYLFSPLLVVITGE